jgi:hypothetical protein
VIVTVAVSVPTAPLGEVTRRPTKGSTIARAAMSAKIPLLFVIGSS